MNTLTNGTFGEVVTNKTLISVLNEGGVAPAFIPVIVSKWDQLKVTTGIKHLEGIPRENLTKEDKRLILKSISSEMGIEYIKLFFTNLPKDPFVTAILKNSLSNNSDSTFDEVWVQSLTNGFKSMDINIYPELIKEEFKNIELTEDPILDISLTLIKIVKKSI